MTSNDFIKRVFVFCVFLLAGYANAGEKQFIKPCPSAKAKLECIRDAHNRLDKQVNEEDLKLYFECLPDNFKQFRQLFGYEDDGYNTKFGVLYESYPSYMSFLEKSSSVVPKEQYYSKLIDMASEGVWQADGVNYLKHIIDSAIKKDFTSLEIILSKQTEEKIKGFWLFYFDTAHGLKLDESICSGDAVNGKACQVLSELVRSTIPEEHTHH